MFSDPQDYNYTVCIFFKIQLIYDHDHYHDQLIYDHDQLIYDHDPQDYN
jgi:hypothetical protein